MRLVDREQLARRIAEIALLRGTFILRSGRASDFYLDKYMFSTRPEILLDLGKMFAARLPKEATMAGRKPPGTSMARVAPVRAPSPPARAMAPCGCGSCRRCPCER